MKKILALIGSTLFLSTMLEGGTVRLINDSPFKLRAVVRANDQTFLGEMIVSAQNSSTWTDTFRALPIPTRNNAPKHPIVWNGFVSMEAHFRFVTLSLLEGPSLRQIVMGQNSVAGKYGLKGKGMCSRHHPCLCQTSSNLAKKDNSISSNPPSSGCPILLLSRNWKILEINTPVNTKSLEETTCKAVRSLNSI